MFVGRCGFGGSYVIGQGRDVEAGLGEVDGMGKQHGDFLLSLHRPRMACTVTATDERGTDAPLRGSAVYNSGVREAVDRLRRGADSVLDASPCSDVFEHELHEVGIAVLDHDLRALLGRLLAGPGGLARGPVTVEPGARRGHPLAQPVPRVGEVAMPGDRP